MLPTRLTVWLFVASLGLVPLGVWFEWCRWLLLGLQAGLFGMFLLDGLWARGTVKLHVRRDRPARLSLGTANDIHLLLENLGTAQVDVLVRDTPPAQFPAEPAVLECSLAGHRAAQAGYRLVPTERGDFTFGNIHVRVRSPLGLAWIDRTIPAAETVPVYPNLLETRRYEALLRSTLTRTGGYRTRQRLGGGREFSHFREYSPDDDYKGINWKATARRGKPISTVFESEHSQDIIFCLDVGRMMAARVGTLTKLDHAINAILMLSHVSQAFQDNLGLLIFSHSVHRWLPPAKGRAQHAHFLQALYSVKPELCYVNYRQAFTHLIARHPKRALTMIFTDLLDAVVSTEYREAVRLLRQFHLPLTLAVADVPLQELAGRTPGNVTELYDILVARDLLHGRAEMLRSLERQGVPVLDTVPERLTVDAVNRYLEIKTGIRT
jgi:uncharacterized protein (DUF58 family)